MHFFVLGEIITMNILIVGNGFDLSHYLPTKYDHFMDVMTAIEEKDTGGKKGNLEVNSLKKCMDLLDDMFERKKDEPPLNYQMNFDELFSKTRDPNFIEKTKEFYLTENIEICAKDIVKLQYRLELNCWYQYFKNHVEEIKTWIDFEQKIESALALVCRFIRKIDSKFEKYGKVEPTLKFLTKTNSEKDDNLFYISELDFKLLVKLKLCMENNDFGKTKSYGGLGAMPDNRKGFISNSWFHAQEKIDYGFSAEKYISFLNSQLEEFIEIFNLYLNLIVDKLKTKNSFIIDSENWQKPEKIFSFNYTSTYQQIHVAVAVEYLHGSHGEKQNIVLGIDELKDESLKKLKAFGFTKYHQKLFKDTDYLFLDIYKNKIKMDKQKVIDLKDQLKGEIRSEYRNYLSENIDTNKENSKLNLNIAIWGHSLDVSDKDYIIDLFSLNDGMDRNVSITVYYFDKNAKFSLLNNLLSILDKDKVEYWMKNKWLEFKENPKIIDVSEIELENLPKIAQA